MIRRYSTAGEALGFYDTGMSSFTAAHTPNLRHGYRDDSKSLTIQREEFNGVFLTITGDVHHCTHIARPEVMCWQINGQSHPFKLLNHRPDLSASLADMQ
jgi:hypothetical protein